MELTEEMGGDPPGDSASPGGSADLPHDPDRDHVGGGALVAEAPGLPGLDGVHGLQLGRAGREPAHRLAVGRDRQAADADHSAPRELGAGDRRHHPVGGAGLGRDLDHLAPVLVEVDRVGQSLGVVRERGYGNGAHCATSSLRAL